MTIEYSNEHAELISALKNELLIVLVNRLGGDISIPIKEIDDVPRGKGLAFYVDHETGVFHFKLTGMHKAPQTTQ